MRVTLLLASCLLASACSDADTSTASDETESPATTQAPAETVSEVSSSDTECNSEVGRLEGSGICRDQADAVLNIVDGEPPLLPDNCTWELQETPFADQYLLYLAASCDGTTAKLGYEGGARSASLILETSAIAPFPADGPGGGTAITVIGSDADAPDLTVLGFAKQAMTANQNPDECIIRSAFREGWPTEALVVDEANPPMDQIDGPRSACGPFGYTEESAAYWRVFDDHSWFFDLGQDAYADFDPRTLTLVPAKDAS